MDSTPLVDARKDLGMRVFWNWNLRTFVVASTLAACSMIGDSSYAQFREVTPDQPQNVIDEDSLQQTREQFVPPMEAKVVDPTTLEPTPQKLAGEPTLAEPPAAKTIIESKEPTLATESEKPAPKATVKGSSEPATAAVAKKTASTVSPESAADTDSEILDPFSLFGPPASAADDPASDDSYALTFNGVQPGGQNIAEVRDLWGQPAKLVEVDGSEKLVYKAPGYRQVDIVADGTHADDTKLNVHSIVIHLEEPEDAIELSTQLHLDDIIPTIVEDEKGAPLGVAFPERGVLFGLAADHETVTTISMEPIHGELFRLRAENDELNNYVQSVRDLNTAIQLNDRDAHAYWLLAELYSQIGQSDSAYDAAMAAASRSEEPLYQLTKARLLAEQGSHSRAIREVAAIAKDLSVREIVRARAHYVLGNLQATGVDANFETSLTSHTKAIDLAANHLNSKVAKVRRMSKDILIDAHLAVAQDIALGNYQRQEEVVPKWLIRATELAENFLENDRGEDTLRMEVYRATLAAYSVLPGNFDASVAAEEVLSEGKRLLSESQDALYQRRVERELIEALFYASKIEHQHGRFENAASYADNATSLIDLNDESATRFDRYVAGQLYFLKGSLHAIHEQDHQEAVEWYAKARPILEDKTLDSLVNRSAFGELFVSMGVSYWEVGEKETAIELTESGTELLQAAVQENTLPLDVLSVPYSNLSSMHTSLGNTKNAKHFQEMMAKVDQGTKQR
ncbi:hypothetical protein ACFL2H_03805 [Planctomycetota bacterium]